MEGIAFRMREIGLQPLLQLPVGCYQEVLTHFLTCSFLYNAETFVL